MLSSEIQDDSPGNDSGGLVIDGVVGCRGVSPLSPAYSTPYKCFCGGMVMVVSVDSDRTAHRRTAAASRWLVAVFRALATKLLLCSTFSNSAVLDGERPQLERSARSTEWPLNRRPVLFSSEELLLQVGVDLIAGEP